jgi:hypothetical protein
MPRKEEVLRIREAQCSRATSEFAKRFKTGVVQRRGTPACRRLRAWFRTNVLHVCGEGHGRGETGRRNVPPDGPRRDGDAHLD